MRRALLLLLALLSTSALAQEEAPGEWVPYPLRLGADVGLLMRQEAGGQRTPLPALVLRAGYGQWGPVQLGAVYQLAFALEGTVVRGFTQHHRLHLRPEAVWHLGSTWFSASAGPGVQLLQTSIWDPNQSIGSLYLRGCVGGELAVGVQLDALRVRTGLDVTWAPGRLDLLLSVGASFGFWEDE